MNATDTTTTAAITSCEDCWQGFRTDCMARDHYGVDTAETRACVAGTAPCPEHRCYAWAEQHADAAPVHRCDGYACPAIHLDAAAAREAVRAHTAAGWDVVSSTRDTVTMGRLGERVSVTTAARKIDPWE